jgi:hypothetical protein
MSIMIYATTVVLSGLKKVFIYGFPEEMLYLSADLRDLAFKKGRSEKDTLDNTYKA